MRVTKLSKELSEKLARHISDKNILEFARLLGAYLCAAGSSLKHLSKPLNVLDRLQHISREISFYNFFISLCYGTGTGYKAKLLAYVKEILPNTPAIDRVRLYERWCRYIEAENYEKLKEEAWVFGGLDNIEAPPAGYTLKGYGPEPKEVLMEGNDEREDYSDN